MRAVITTEDITPAEACARAAASPAMLGMDYVKEVTTAGELRLGSRRARTRATGPSRIHPRWTRPCSTRKAWMFTCAVPEPQAPHRRL